MNDQRTGSDLSAFARKAASSIASCPRVRASGVRFLDAYGREVLLRGVNLGGDSKVPWPNGGTHHPTDFSDHRGVSFIGRPFPLSQADEHFGRLRHWGFNCLRLLTTWEAVEHAGPGQYDVAYLDYFAELCRLAGQQGLYVFVDFHQDVWSRMSGGDGAPGWTFDAVGLDFTKFDAAGAAHVMQHVYDYRSSEAQQAAYPQMSWSRNYRLPANAIMWTLFWGGRWITPQFRIDGVNVQDYLQQHYLGAMDQVARRIATLTNVLGFDTLNEPDGGWIGQRLTYRHVEAGEESPAQVRPGPALAALDALAIARGIPTRVPVMELVQGKLVPAHVMTFNPHGVSIWRPGAACPFESAGAYEVVEGQARCLNDQIFRSSDGRARSLSEDGYGPFFHAVAATIRRHQPQWSLFAEMDPWGVAVGGRRFPAELPPRTVNAFHWYDVTLLYSKRFDSSRSVDWRSGAVATTPEQIGERYFRELQALAKHAQGINGGAPSLVGEFGVPFDLEHGKAYREWSEGQRDVWGDHVTALSLMYDALDRLGLHATIWNYTVSNRNHARIGDGWNQEDLSIFSRDQQDEPTIADSGGRALPGFCRPFPRFLQGRLLSMRFSAAERRFVLELDADPTVPQPSEIYLPAQHFPEGYEIQIDGSAHDVERSDAGQVLRFRSSKLGRMRIEVTASSKSSG